MKDTLRDTPPAPRNANTTGLAPAIDGYATSANNQVYDSSSAAMPATTSHHHHNATTSTTASGLESGYSTTGTNMTGLAGTSGHADPTSHHHHTMTTPHHDSTASLPAGHGTGHANETQSVIDKLNANVQASVRETTGRKDLDVAEEQPKTSAGKRILEGLGLGGDERKTTLKGVDEA